MRIVEMNASKDFIGCVVQQVEYYFSDENLIRAKFLRDKIKQNADGWVHLNVIVKFKRLAALTENTKHIGKYIARSGSKSIEISTDLQRVRRVNNKPIPVKNKTNKSELISRSAYVEGFSKKLGIDYLMEFFKPYSAVHIIIRKYLDKETKAYLSKGSAFITFKTKKECADFLGKTVVLDGVPLVTMHQEIFIEMQQNEKIAKKNTKKNRCASCA